MGMSAARSETGPSIDVLVCDDNFIVLAGLVAALRTDEGISVVGEAADGLEAIALAEELLPEVVVLDIRMPGMDGIETARRLSMSVPSSRILIVTWSEEPEHLTQAVIAGAKGYLVHGHFTPEDLIDAVRTLYGGGGLITPAVVPALLRVIQERLQTGDGPLSPLTEREVQVLRQIGEGHCNREIAFRLGVREKTVKNHINNIYSKLHVQNRREARLEALRLAR